MTKTKILFVCLGNICRSPSAEAVMKAMVEKAGLSNVFEIDSAGIIGVHEGENADSRMMAHAASVSFPPFKTIQK
jgi:protein-tyrosine phosphatase